MADTITDTTPAPDVFVAAPENVIALDARIDDAKAEIVYGLAMTKSGVTNNKVYPSVKDADYKAARRDLVKHVSSRLNDGFVARVTNYKPVDGSAGVSFKVNVRPKSNRGRKAAATK